MSGIAALATGGVTTLAGLITSGIQAGKGKKMINSANEEINNVMASRQDYGGAKDLQSEYNTLKSQTQGRSSLTGLLQERARDVMPNYLDAVRTGSVSSSQMMAGAGAAANTYAKASRDAAITGYQDNQQKMSQRLGLASQLAQQDQLKYEYNVLTPYLQKMENAQAKLGYGHNMRNAGLSGITGTVASSATMFGQMDWANMGFGGGGKAGATMNPLEPSGTPPFVSGGVGNSLPKIPS